ncbi:YhdP family protein [Candidatus Berkiella aquae]|uniref:TIGR02099 family protein n=1 Tax=Candidatus Berkiella aquae TaxID=295108 RepID=A0AAE3HU75_9GAMM|nr:YhdP family protein [Candidatus Berkiella aquae]MCS5710713.1 TIGR02099 family protein [Candidatus Berkiella aquae]
MSIRSISLSSTFKMVRFYKFYRLLGWLSIGTAVLLTMLRTLLPLYSPNIDEFNQLLRSQLACPVVAQTIKLSWEGLHPVATLTNVSVKQSIHINKLKLSLSMKHLLLGRLQLSQLNIDGAKLGIDYRDHNKISLINLPEISLDLKNTNSKKIPLEHLQIVNAQLEILQQDKQFLLQDVAVKADLTTHVKIHAHAHLQGEQGAKIDFSLDKSLLTHAPLKAYVHWVGGELEKIIPYNINAQTDVKAWLTMHDLEDMQIVADVKLADLKAKTTQGKSFAYDKLGGIFQIKRQDAKWAVLGKDGFCNDISDISFAIKNKTCDTSTCWHLQAKHLPLKPLHELTNLFTKKFEHYETKGELDYLNVKLETSNEQIKPVDIEMVFHDIGIFKPTMGGITGMSGALVYTQDKGSLLLDSERFNIHYNKWFSQVLPLSHLSATVHWQQENQQLKISANEIAANLGETSIAGQVVATFANGLKESPQVEMQWEVGALPTEEVLAFLPKTMDIDLLEWLNQAIVGGEAEKTTMVLRGDLAKFPFDNQEGIFEIFCQLNHTTLDYTQGWPALNDLKASLLFRNRALYIGAEHAWFEGGELLKADAVIPDLLSPLPALRIDTKIKSTLENGLQVIQKSPIKETLGKELAPLALKGPMDLALGLDVPLSDQSTDTVKVRGVIALTQAQIGVPSWNIEIPKVAGEISFTENSVKADTLTGYLLDSPADFHIESKLQAEEPELRIHASGKMVSDRLLNWLKAPDFKHMSGDTDYQAELVVTTVANAKQVNLTVNSTLAGLVVDAPTPLAKEASETKISECKIHFDPNDLVRIAFKYGDNLNLAYSLLHQDGKWRSLGGHIHVGEKRLAKYREDNVLLIDGDLSELDVGKWQDFIKQSGMGASADKSTLEPLVELKIEQLKLFGEEFAKASIEAQWENTLQHWNIVFDGPSLKGSMILPQDDNKDIQIDLQKLKLTGNSEIASFWDNQEHTQMKQSIDIKIAELGIDKKMFTQIQARLVPFESGYQFNKVKANIKDTSIELNGEWTYLIDKKVTAKGKVTTENIGAALQALGKEGTLKGASGTVEFALAWEGSPAKIDYASLDGQASLSLNQGYVQGVNPGIGRILSLLNLDNVKRRLKLDFSDVTKSGFAFDELNGKFQFGKGKVSTNKITLNGPSAKIEAFGQADLLSQGLSGEMVVMPDVTGSLPVAAAIAAGNPAIGAAVWVVDKMFGQKIQEINRFRYQILGSWQAPQVKEVPIVSLSNRG